MTSTYIETCMIPLAELTPFPGNARRGDPEKIAESITANGQYRALVVRRSGVLLTVLAGNHTLKGLEILDVPAARCEIIECDEETARRINLVDNKISDDGTYDDVALAALLGALDDFTGTGYTEDDLSLLTARHAPVPTLEELAEEHGEPEPGDLWPVLSFKVAPEIRARFFALTEDAASDDPAARLLRLIEQAEDC